MFGPKLLVTTKQDKKILLRPLKKDDMVLLADSFSNPKVRMWTANVNGVSLEDEEDWYEKTRQTKNSYHWAIVPEGQDELIGVTGLHGVYNVDIACSSGIIIFNTDWWGCGVASATHLARVWYAAYILNINIIKTAVFDKNEASRKALESVGYAVTGVDPCEHYRNGSYHDLIKLRWFNPHRINLLFPKGLPEQYASAVQKAAKALEDAKTKVVLI